MTSKDSPHRLRGISTIVAAVSMLMIVGLVGLSIDTGYAVLVASQLHNAADAADLAGAPNG